jgi:hypothetical protein
MVFCLLDYLFVFALFCIFESSYSICSLACFVKNLSSNKLPRNVDIFLSMSLNFIGRFIWR